MLENGASAGKNRAPSRRNSPHGTTRLEIWVGDEFVLYDAGVDVHKDDFLGRLSLSENGTRRRDCWVFEKCVKEGIPIAGGCDWRRV